MAIIYDVQTNYQAKIEQSNEMIEKGYIDQAICFLEDFLVCVQTAEIERAVKKQLVTAYFLKREFETAEQLISEILKKNGLDLSLVAHDILVATFQNHHEQSQEKENVYGNQLQSFAKKNLIELVYQLKTYYETYWDEQLRKKVMTLEKNPELNVALTIVSDLQEVETERLVAFKEKLENTANHCPSPLIKRAIFELLAQKNLECVIRFEEDGEVRNLPTEPLILEQERERIDQVLNQLEKLEIDPTLKEALIQPLIFFYQSSFPFANRLREDEVIFELLRQLFGVEIEVAVDEGVLKRQGEANPDIAYKMSQYILSLSSLM